MSWLLIFVPISIGLEFLAPGRHLLIFVTSSLAILPLAGWMGRATEQLAERMGEGVGGLLNATFGNAAELIIALAALRAGLYDVVKASIAGSIVGNILLVLGAAMLAGGLRRSEQHFNATGARSQATMLLLAAIALIVPAAFQVASGATAEGLGRLEHLDFRRAYSRIFALFSLRTRHPFRTLCRALSGRKKQHTSFCRAFRACACRSYGSDCLDKRDLGGGNRTHRARVRP